MKFRIVSDLHCEFHRDGGNSLIKEICGGEDFDVLLIAGDLHIGWDNIEKTLHKLNSQQVFIIPGNHEFYKQDFFALRHNFDSRMHSEILNNKSIIYSPLKLVGSTLWFREDSFSKGNEWRLNDFNVIKNFRENVYKYNQQCIDFLEQEVTSDSIVITHHAPSPKSILPQYQGSSLNRFFVCDVEEMILRKQPKLWIHGHMHNSLDYYLGDTRIVCNPFGYAGVEENPNFDPHLTIEV